MEKVSLGLSLLSILMSIRIGFVPAIGYEVNPIWLFIIIASGLVSIILGIINLNKNVNKKMIEHIEPCILVFELNANVFIDDTIFGIV